MSEGVQIFNGGYMSPVNPSEAGKVKTHVEGEQPIATITVVPRGKFKGQFRFNLRGLNHEIIASGEAYTQKHNAIEVIEKYFPNFVIIDKSKTLKPKK